MRKHWLTLFLFIAAVSTPGCTSRLPGVAGDWQRVPPKQGEPWIRLREGKIDLKRDQVPAAVAMLMDRPAVELTERQAAAMAAEPLPVGASDHWLLVRALGSAEQGFRHHVFTTPDGLELWVSGIVLEHAPREPAPYAVIVAVARVPKRAYVSVSEGE